MSASASKGIMELKAEYHPYLIENRGNQKDENGVPLYYTDDWYPLRNYVGALDYFRYLPAFGKPVPQSTIDMGVAYAQGKSNR